jgi:hypothetical protein
MSAAMRHSLERVGVWIGKRYATSGDTPSVARQYGGLGPRSHVNVGCRQEMGPGR